MFITSASSQNTDLSILKSLNQKNMPVWDRGMKGLSFSVYPVMPVTVAGIWSHGYFKKDKELMRSGYKSALTIGVAVGLSTALKFIVNRQRPFLAYPNEITGRDNVGLASFPSGHTASAFSTATALSLSYKKWYVTAPAYAYAGFVAYSRMRLGVHYPTDVLAGMIIGTGSGFLIWEMDKIVRARHTKKLEQKPDAETAAYFSF